MHLHYFQKRMAVCLILIWPWTTLTAQDPEPLDWTGTKEKWGQVLFCQLIYKMPEVNTRLYDFDVEQCDRAGQFMQNIVSKYSKQEQAQLRNQAEQHAYKLTGNTSEPYHSVNACREYCRTLTESQDNSHD